MSRVPYFTNLFDLLGVTAWRHSPRRERMILAWEERTGLRFPAVMREFYTTVAKLRLGGDRPRYWPLSLTRLWSEYSNDERATPLRRVLRHTARPLRADELGREVEPGPYCWVMTENQGCWLMQARLDGSDDPPVYADEPTFLSPEEWYEREGDWWHFLGRFSEVLFAWMVYYLREADFIPLRFNHRATDPRLRRLTPPKPYHNGLWLRAAREPFTPPAVDYLTEQLGEPECKPQPGGVTTYTFRTDRGLVRVTADAPDTLGGQSAWWLHADDPPELRRLGRMVRPFGRLCDTLTADTDPGRAVLRDLGGRPAAG